MADEAICIGPPPSNQSYLVMERVVDACKQTNAQAVSLVLFNLMVSIAVALDYIIIFFYL